MGIAGHLFIMGKMALVAISQPLAGVLKLSRLRMTSSTGDSIVGCGLIFPLTYQGDYLPGHLLSLSACLAVAVETEPSDPFHPPGDLRVNREMALHAGLIFRRQSG
jgi:hypothetical protein